ncbi:MAG: hypothetical protein KC442_03290, partial [Thermomicrobiales bacterium]|nr:hypothetical protein [Thermomicrobiales bacterium]
MRLLLVITLAGLVLLGSLTARAQEPPLSALLPAAADISADLVQSEDRTRTLSEQASMFANAGEMTQRLIDWGWQENVF